jgi:AraC-like DNA-binding protein/tetratricopeptide (TPR) repeat protein
MNSKWTKWAIIGLLLLPAWTSAIGTTGNYDNAIRRLHQLDHQAFRVLVDSILLSLDIISDPEIKKEVTRQVFLITGSRDEIAHIRSLTYMVLYSDTPRPEYFKQAYALALKYGLKREQNYVHDRTARYYIARRQFDSAVAQILATRDQYRSDYSDEVYCNSLHLLGDIYFDTKLYERAAAEYYPLYRHFLESGPRNDWRIHVLMNNLGQVSQKLGKLPEALYWFSVSLKSSDSQLSGSDKNNIQTYTHLKIAETYLQMGLLKPAHWHMDKASMFPETELSEDVVQELIFIRSQLLLRQGKCSEALAEAGKIVPDSNARFFGYRFIPEVYKLISSIHATCGDTAASLAFLNLYTRKVETLEMEAQSARTMILLAERGNEITRIRNEFTKEKISWLWTSTLALFTLLIILTLLYLKLYRSKRLLVKKTIETQHVVGFIPKMPEPVNDVRNNETLGLRNLLLSLQTLMEVQKIFLEKNLSIQDTARMLNTNRTYLSRAINTLLQTTFPGIVNEYRIQESIRLIMEGYMVNHTLEALAYQCGFANRGVFISAFKKQTGVTPSFFIAHYSEMVK